MKVAAATALAGAAAAAAPAAATTVPYFASSGAVLPGGATWIYGGVADAAHRCGADLHLQGSTADHFSPVSNTSGYRPGARCKASLIPYGDAGLILLGGFDEYGPSSSVYFYEVATNTWFLLENLDVLTWPLQLDAHVATSDGSGTIYVVDRLGVLWLLSILEVTQLPYPAATKQYQWTKLLQFQPAHVFARSGGNGDRLLLYENKLLYFPTATAHCYVDVVDLTTSQTSRINNTDACVRQDALYFLNGNALFVLGGCELDMSTCHSDILKTQQPLSVYLQNATELTWQLVQNDRTEPTFFRGGTLVRRSKTRYGVVGDPVVTPHEPLTTGNVAIVAPTTPIYFEFDLGSASTGCQWSDDCSTCGVATGYDCELKDPPNPMVAQSADELARILCHDHGELDFFGHCICFKGYRGAMCQFGAAECDCGDHGTCDPRTGACACEPGWVGEKCHIQTQCPRNCCNRGVCQDGRCYCYEPYISESCLLTNEDVMMLRADRASLLQELEEYLPLATDPELADKLLQAQRQAKASFEATDDVELYFTSAVDCSAVAPAAIDATMPQKAAINDTSMQLGRILAGKLQSGMSASEQLGYDVYTRQTAAQDAAEAAAAEAAAAAKAQNASAAQPASSGAFGGALSTAGLTEERNAEVLHPAIRYRFLHLSIALSISAAALAGMYLVASPRVSNGF